MNQEAVKDIEVTNAKIFTQRWGPFITKITTPLQTIIFTPLTRGIMFEKIPAFLTELEQNNNKIWFDEHKTTYQELRLEFEEFVTRILIACLEFDNELHKLTPKNCMFRINRDLRFSHNKIPYKTFFSIAMTADKRNSDAPSYYFELHPDSHALVAGGLHLPSNAVLYKIRKYLEEDSTKLEKVLRNKDFKNSFRDLQEMKLKTKPKGFDQNNPKIELLRYTSFVATTTFNIQNTPETKIETQIIEYFRVLSPLVKLTRELAALK